MEQKRQLFWTPTVFIPFWLTKQLNMNFSNAITALLAVVSKRVQIIEV